MRHLPLLFVGLLTAMAVAATPKATVTSISQSADRTVTVAYSLANPPAVVTFAAETNSANGWVALDGRCVSSVSGDIFRKVTAASGTFRWNVDGLGLDGPIASGNLRVKLTAWRTDDTPDYMVVNISAYGIAAADRVRYYTSTNELPGGLLDNSEYRKSMVVMRRLHARGIPWTMGSAKGEPGRSGDDREKQHLVTLTNDYYLGVFPLTVAQVTAIYSTGNSGQTGGFPIDRAMRICDRVYHTNNNFPMRNADWPAAPAAGSVLGKLRTLTAGVIDDWDLPTEAQWEFAARANQPIGYWGNGVEYHFEDGYPYTTDHGMPGRYRYNQGSDWWTVYTDYSKSSQQGVTNRCPIAGSYAPNAYGFYDMHGGIWEWCLDWYAEDITGLNGIVNIDPTDGSKLADGVTAGTKRVMRGGDYKSSASVCRVARRKDAAPTYPGDSQEGGARLCCRAGLK